MVFPMEKGKWGGDQAHGGNCKSAEEKRQETNSKGHVL